jgi:hypothetical protein
VLTDSTSKLITVDQTVQTVQEQAFVVKERVTKVEEVGESTPLRAAAIDDGLAKLDKKVLILERDRDIRIEAKRAFQESINEKATKEAEAKKRMDDLQRCLQQTDLKVGDVLQQKKPQMMLTTAHVAPTRSSTRRAPSFKRSREDCQTTLHSLLNYRLPQPLERTNFCVIERRPRTVRIRHQSFSVGDKLPTPRWNTSPNRD